MSFWILDVLSCTNRINLVSKVSCLSVRLHIFIWMLSNCYFLGVHILQMSSTCAGHWGAFNNNISKTLWAWKTLLIWRFNSTWRVSWFMGNGLWAWKTLPAVKTASGKLFLLNIDQSNYKYSMIGSFFFFPFFFMTERGNQRYFRACNLEE